MGPSGAGKSTLLHVIGMQDGEWGGEYWFDERPVHQLKPKERVQLRNANIGFVFQSYHLLDDLTVYENLEVPLTYRNVKRSERQAIIAEALDRFRIVAKKDLYPRQLSGGQQQLVGVARAVIANPKLLRGRANRQPAFDPRRGNYGAVPGIEPGGNNNHSGHPF
jgi:ABC-type lipoprotein export system ATPase subunit